MRQDIKYTIFNRVTFQWMNNLGEYTRNLNDAEFFNDIERINEFLLTLKSFGDIIDLSQIEIQKYKATYVFDSKIEYHTLK